jgi:iron complex outermembrane receptor protein
LSRASSPTRANSGFRSLVSFLGIAVLAAAAPVDFSVPAQPADSALLAFARQASAEVLFSFDELHRVGSPGVTGEREPDDALKALLKGTGFSAHRNAIGRYVVARAPQTEGSIRGMLLTPDGTVAQGVHVVIPALRLSVDTDAGGRYQFDELQPGSYQVFATGAGYQTLQIDEAHVVAGRALTLETFSMQVAREPSQLAPFVVEAKSARSPLLLDVGSAPAPRTAIGDVDQPRSENDALSYTVFDREKIARSGVTNLNEFLKRELLDSDATTLPPEQNARTGAFASGSQNLNLRGYGADETIVLVDGRRLPELVTALPANLTSPSAPQSDVNVIPINLIERIEVLPASASAIYSGSPVGGVINIVLRPDINTTEFTTTYTNALANYDAPQLTTSLLHGETLLGGALRVRLNATFTEVTPATESELGYIRRNLAVSPQPEDSLFRATPNVSSAVGAPLFGPGTASTTSVAPGSEGTGGLAPFEGRQGEASLGLYQAPGGGLTNSAFGLDSPFGRQETTTSLYGSVTYDVAPWLQIGLDGSAGRTVNHTGYSVFAGSLVLPSSSAFNPFHQDVDVTLNETTPQLGANYDEAHIDYYSAVLGVLLKLPANWQASLDAQYGLNVTQYRGIQGVDTSRWQQLVTQGVYNPLRDTQVSGPPQQFYDQALIFYGREGSFVTLGDYDTFDASLRVTDPSFHFPTGSGTLTLGGDYRLARLATFVNALRYGDGSLVAPPDVWEGRTLQRISTFFEAQAPLLPARWLPPWIHAIDLDVALRYTASTLANEANYAPTGAVKVDLPGGISLRGSFAQSNTFPPPYFSRLKQPSIGTSGVGTVATENLFDPRLQKFESVLVSDAVNPNLVPEAAITQTAGIVYEKGSVHRLRASVDFSDTVTSGEQQYLGPDQVIDLEPLFPQRVVRAASPAGDPSGVGPITNVYTGNFNLAWRHSYEWSASLDYAWSDVRGGTLEAYCRWIYFQRYDVELLPTSSPVDELRAPDGLTPGLLKHRANFGSSWSSRGFGFGVDGHYFYSRILPLKEQESQGGAQVDPYWQFDAFVQADLGRWLPWNTARYGLRGQLRVDNVFGAGPPRYANDPSGAGVQEYTDWRGRVYSVSVTLSF